MRPVDVKKLRYHDPLASKRHRRIRLIGTGVLVGVLVVGGGLVYSLFYTPWLQANEVVIEGLSEAHKAEALQIVEKALAREVLGVPVGRNLFFLRSDDLGAELGGLSFLAGADIKKDYPHTLKITGTERQSEGIWCIKDSCRYFDSEGIVWGEAAASSGFLFLAIEDRRAATFSQTVDRQFLAAIKMAKAKLEEQGVKTKQVIIPEDTFTDFNLLVSDPAVSAGAVVYSVKFSLDSDLAAQADAYLIFRTQKLSAGGFQPQYVDMRFDGRVYFK